MYLNEAGKKTQKTTKKGAGIETGAAGAEGAEGRLHSVRVPAHVWVCVRGRGAGGGAIPQGGSGKAPEGAQGQRQPLNRLCGPCSSAQQLDTQLMQHMGRKCLSRQSGSAVSKWSRWWERFLFLISPRSTKRLPEPINWTKDQLSRPDTDLQKELMCRLKTDTAEGGIFHLWYLTTLITTIVTHTCLPPPSHQSLQLVTEARRGGRGPLSEAPQKRGSHTPQEVSASTFKVKLI